MRTLVFTQTAKEDLEAIDAYLSDDGGYFAADAVLAKLSHRCERLAILPGTLGTARPDLGDDLRSVPESGFVIFFRYLDAELQVINILHGSRDIISFYDTGDHA